MRRIRVLWLMALLLAPHAAVYGLGLGSIEQRSALNQPFEARIPLVNASADEIETLIVKLAGNDQFVRAGVDRAEVLGNLRFEVVQTAKGADYIRVSSHDPISEPFLDFLVEISWSRGKIIREYTVLLDPPLYVPTRPSPISTPTAARAPVSTVAPVSTYSAPSAAPATAAGGTESWRRNDSVVYSGGKAVAYGSTPSTPYASTPASVPSSVPSRGGGNTLWSIATATRPDTSVSVQQMMMAILKANPDAFKNGNINGLKRGYVDKLVMPDTAALNELTRAQAFAEAKRQNALWQEYRQGAAQSVAAQPAASVPAMEQAGEMPADKPEAQSAPTADQQTSEKASWQQLDSAPSDTLKIVGANDATAGAANALAQEQLASAQSENEELKSQLVESEQIIQNLRDRMSLQDNQLAELQLKLSEASKPAPVAAPPAPEPAPAAELPAPAEPAPVAETTPEPAVAPAAEPAAPEPVAPEPVAPEPVAPEPVAEVKPEPAPAAEPAAEPQPEATPMAAEEPAEAKPAKKKLIRVDISKPKKASAFAEFMEVLKNSVNGAVTAVKGMLAGLIPQSLLEKIPGGMPALLGGVLAIILGIFGLARAVMNRSRTIGEFKPSIPGRKKQVAVADEDEAITQFAQTEFDPGATKPGTKAEERDTEERTQIVVPPGAPSKPEEDPLAEVNVYLAYERFDEAEKLIKQAIAKEPARHEYKTRLLEVYYSSNNKAAFESTAKQLRDQIGVAHPGWQDVLSMWREMSPNRELFTGGGDLEHTTQMSSAEAKKFVDITADTSLPDRVSDTLVSNLVDSGFVDLGISPQDSDGILDISSSGQDDILDISAAGSTAVENFIDLTGSVPGVTEATAVAGADNALDFGVLDVTGSDPSFQQEMARALSEVDAKKVEPESPGLSLSLAGLSATVDKELKMASSDDDLLGATKPGNLAAAEGLLSASHAAGTDNLLDVTKSGIATTATGDLDALDLLNITKPGGSINQSPTAAGDLDLEQGLSGLLGADAPASGSVDTTTDTLERYGAGLTDTVAIAASGVPTDGLEFDLSGFEMPATASTSTADLAKSDALSTDDGLQFDLSASAGAPESEVAESLAAIAEDDGIQPLAFDMGESGDAEISLADAADADSAAAEISLDGLSMDLAADEISLDGMGAAPDGAGEISLDGLSGMSATDGGLQDAADISLDGLSMSADAADADLEMSLDELANSVALDLAANTTDTTDAGQDISLDELTASLDGSNLDTSVSDISLDGMTDASMVQDISLDDLTASLDGSSLDTSASDISLDGLTEASMGQDISAGDISLDGVSDISDSLGTALGADSISLDGLSASMSDISLDGEATQQLGTEKLDTLMMAKSAAKAEVEMELELGSDAPLGMETVRMARPPLAESTPPEMDFSDQTVDLNSMLRAQKAAPPAADLSLDDLSSLDVTGLTGDVLDMSAPGMLMDAGDEVSLTDLAKSLEDTVTGIRKEADKINADDMEVDFDPLAGMFDETPPAAHTETQKFRAGDNLPAMTESTVVMPNRQTEVDEQTMLDSADTNLSLAKAYIELGDTGGARTLLDEVLANGSPAQRMEAQKLLQGIQ